MISYIVYYLHSFVSTRTINCLEKLVSKVASLTPLPSPTFPRVCDKDMV